MKSLFSIFLLSALCALATANIQENYAVNNCGAASNFPILSNPDPTNIRLEEAKLHWNSVSNNYVFLYVSHNATANSSRVVIQNIFTDGTFGTPVYLNDTVGVEFGQPHLIHNTIENKYLVVFEVENTATADEDVWAVLIDFGLTTKTYIQLAVGPDLSEEPTVAWNKATNRYLVAYENQEYERSTAPAIKVEQLDNTGAVVGFGAVIQGAYTYDNPRIKAYGNNSDFYMVFEHLLANNSTEILGVNINLANGGFSISPIETIITGHFHKPQIGVNPTTTDTHFLIVMDEEYDNHTVYEYEITTRNASSTTPGEVSGIDFAFTYDPVFDAWLFTHESYDEVVQIQYLNFYAPNVYKVMNTVVNYTVGDDPVIAFGANSEALLIWIAQDFTYPNGTVRRAQSPGFFGSFVCVSGAKEASTTATTATSTPATTDSSTTPSSSHSGAAVAVVIIVIVALIVAAAVVSFIIWRKKNSNNAKFSNFLQQDDNKGGDQVPMSQLEDD